VQVRVSTTHWRSCYQAYPSLEEEHKQEGHQRDDGHEHRRIDQGAEDLCGH
jgi:hypothetical protein